MIRYILNVMYVFILKCRFGDSFKISKCSKTHLLPKIRISKGGMICIGDYFKCDKNVTVEACGGRIEIGNDVFLNSNVKIVSMGTVSIGNGCLVAPNVCVYDHDHDYSSNNMQNNYSVGKINIMDKVWIGANSVVCKNSEIGKETVIGAGSVVKGIIPNNNLFIQKRDDRLIPIK